MNHKHLESMAISEQIAYFLAAGKEIEKVPAGVGKDNPFPTETHMKAQANGAKATKRKKGESRWHGPAQVSKSARWNDGAMGVM